jgi:hypothetical protein
MSSEQDPINTGVEANDGKSALSKAQKKKAKAKAKKEDEKVETTQ